MERDRFARKVGRFVEKRIMDIDLVDTFLVASVLGVGIILRDKILQKEEVGPKVKTAVEEIVRASKF